MIKVLIIDDDRHVRKFLARYLQSLGPHEVRLASTGRRGLMMARHDRPNLILLDWVLREGLSGDQVLAALKSHAETKSIPVVMMSGIRVSAEDEARARQAGADFFFAKIELNDSTPAVKRHIESLLVRLSTPCLGRVLVIEDDFEFCELIRFTLTRKGYEVHSEHKAGAGVYAAQSLRPGLILLDLGLEGANGVEVYNLLQADDRTRGIPILIMTAMDDSARVVRSLVMSLGANGFLQKPFGENELLRHVRRLYGSDQRPAGAQAASRESVLQRGSIRINLDSRQVWVDGRLMKNIQRKRFELLRVLMEREEGVSRHELLSLLWEQSDPKIVDVTIGRLRKNLGSAAERIVSIPAGYKLSAA